MGVYQDGWPARDCDLALNFRTPPVVIYPGLQALMTDTVHTQLFCVQEVLGRWSRGTSERKLHREIRKHLDQRMIEIQPTKTIGKPYRLD